MLKFQKLSTIGNMVTRGKRLTETVVEGFDQIPKAFIDLFEGRTKVNGS
jgi:NADPH-dependent curcumin reductase CurA